jgi:hypothetical protein
MKYTWRVSPVPIGRYKSFNKRGWPFAEYENGDIACHIICKDSYSKYTMLTGLHSVLTVMVADHSSGKLVNRNLKQTFKTLNEAKTAFKRFIKAHPEFIPTEKPPLGIMPYTLWIDNRIQEIGEAIKRYENSKFKNEFCVTLWKEEINNLNLIRIRNTRIRKGE